VEFIFFDHVSTTPVDPPVMAAMLPYFSKFYGNPSSHIHPMGIQADEGVQKARGQVADLINCSPEEVIFTSGGTESNNLALKGIAAVYGSRGKHLVLSEIEHYSVLNPALTLQKQGWEITKVPVNPCGRVEPEELKKALRKDTSLVSVMLANSEIGTIQPIAEIAEIVKTHGALFFVDGVAGCGNVPVDVKALGADALSLSGHNFYGPKGIGALFLRKDLTLDPQIEGGFQERGYRSGTENVPGIVGMGKAAELAREEMPRRTEHLRSLQRRLWEGLEKSIEHLHFTGHPNDRLPGHVSFWVEFAEGESLLLFLSHHGVMAASGSACSSNLKGRDEGDMVVSHVLKAVGVPTDICQGSITFSLGKDNSVPEVDFVVGVVPKIVERLWAMSPMYADYLKKRN
jgi:cysteine desulfurase